MLNNLSNILERISFYRISGVKNFVVLDIHKKYAHCTYIEIKEPFYQITKEKLNTTDKIIYSEIIEYDNDLSFITNSLKKLSDKFKLEEALIILGINEFRFNTIKIDIDTEDKELWFLENTDKFLPEGRQIDDFLFSYEKYSEDEDNEYYCITIARKIFIENITKACQINGLRIISISTFPLSIHTLNFAKEKNILFLNVVFDKIIYSFSNSKTSLIYSELFLNKTKTDFEINNGYQNIHDIDTIIFCLNEIKQNLNTFLPAANEELQIFFSSQNILEQEIAPHLRSIFLTELINKEPFDIEASHLSSIIAINKLLTGNDKSINLLPVEVELVNREYIEKKTSLKLILTLGSILVFLLLSIYFVEGVLNTQIQNNENNLIEIDVKAKMVENLNDANNNLTKNLSILTKLKGERIVFSKILYSIIEGIGNNGCLTNFLITESNNGLQLNLQGLSYSQKDVTDIINRIEILNNFNNITLEYANLVEKSKFRSNIILPRKTMINFSILANYYEN
ncbi:MAG: hypothetical protein KKF62_14020 [Bacteroidetes bacterium]|nr:hypothetical protein [Bacteroidota bacterium]MBU1114216.1 hypothetical protein [Bacteroidota bacterium]MBU1797025.1 hypothetical protein [Bacteroidota bacterium]